MKNKIDKKVACWYFHFVLYITLKSKGQFKSDDYFENKAIYVNYVDKHEIVCFVYTTSR